MTDFVTDASRLLSLDDASSQGLDRLVWSRPGIKHSMEDVLMPADKSLGQIYYEEVEALKAGGTSNADAIREVAKKHNKKENAVRGSLHQYKTKHIDGDTSPTRRGRRAAPTVDDYLATARRSLEDALALVDREVDDAKTALDTAQARYDDVVASVTDKKADIEKKLAALA